MKLIQRNGWREATTMDHGRGLPSGTMVAGDWRIERTLGAGGFGVTYEARSRRTGAHAALKEYVPSGLCTRPAGSTAVTPAQGPAGDIFKRGLTGFMKEAETLARLDHPSIVRVSDYFEANGTAYMALDFIEGGSLANWLKRLGRRPTEDELDRLLWPLTEALREVHALFVLHRDIKPNNIMLKADCTPVLIDFGAVKSLVSSETRSIGAGTLNFVTDGYAPPEQYVAGGDGLLGPWTDVYALGATLYEAITGERPPSATYRQVDETYRPLATNATAPAPLLGGDETRAVGAGLRPALLVGIDRALSLRRGDRPQSMMEFRRAIELERPPSRSHAPFSTRQPEDEVRPATFSSLTADEPKAASAPPRSRLGLLLGTGAATCAVLAVALAMLGPLRPGSTGRSGVAEPPPQGSKPTATSEAAERRAREAEDARKRAEQEAAGERAKAKQLAEALEKEKRDREAVDRERQRAAGLAEEERRRREAEDVDRWSKEAARQRAESEARRQAEAEQRRRDEEARRRQADPISALAPGSGQSTRDRLADGSACSFCPEMVVVPAGSFRMGSPFGEDGRQPEEGPAREVRVRQAFAVGRVEVTLEEWDACVTDTGCQHRPNDEGWGRGRRPAINVSWDDITKQYLPWLNRRTGRTYRLLTEAEWEYAARAGTTTRYAFGNEFSSRNANNSSIRTVEVGQFPANSWGLRDMHGNVWEWVEDCWNDNHRDASGDERARTTACSDAGRRVFRGGSWLGGRPGNLRSAVRGRGSTTDRSSYVGFRLARTLSP